LIDTTIDTLHINFSAETLWVLNFALAFVMFGIALEISISDFKRLLKDPKPILVGVFSQFLVLPAITFLLVLLMKPIPSIALGMFIVAACPGGNISNFITYLAKGNTALSVSLTAIATLLAIVMTPLNLQLWGSWYQPTSAILTEVAISPFEMIKLVSLLLGVPLIVGMWFNHLRPILASKLAVAYVFWLVVIHNLVAFTTGFSLARVFGLSQQNLRSITVETGIQNSGLGLLLIFTFFDGLGGTALLAAFWGIWHLISGLSLATFWGYKPSTKEELI